MNKRIKELAEQAGLYAELHGHGPWPRAMSAEESEVAYQKFTKLIAEECARMCMSQADRRNIRERFGLPVESSVKYKGPDPSNSIESQYDRELNTNRIK